MDSRSYEEMSSSDQNIGGSEQKTSYGSSDSFNGLKFGQEIYFKDVGLGVSAKSCSGSSSFSTSSSSLLLSAAGGGCSASQGAPTPTKKGRGVVQTSQPPRCRVEGCRVDLSDAKAYYSRHKVCGMHSKSAKVIVAGLEQRFCQQCSRFHQLSEFDEGKRSCRRRLAGHNERRRKPPAGSLLSSRLGRLSSSIFDSHGRSGSFLVDFTAYPRPTGPDAWPGNRASSREAGNHSSTSPGKFPDGTPGNSETLLQGSALGTCFSSPDISSGDCFTRVPDSSCALSLLSNHHWDSTNRASGIERNNSVNVGAAAMAESAMPSGVGICHFASSSSWGFKGGEASSGLFCVPPHLGLGQITQPPSSEYDGEIEMVRHSGRQFMEDENSRGYDSSTHYLHWSL
ncbi:hypothetical protein Nepgr_031205 [Nepenthes gracilis]|uniref:SBP-type domain-containing protein n=1 Tax=Nepenthes gracilis TaxID=150966 RepID=A0AAD3TH39_NEPGR|nr:hypothetical protein Nepgr_031205 [Nepenthes gracilis]